MVGKKIQEIKKDSYNKLFLILLIFLQRTILILYVFTMCKLT
jgi:hypothetical protein